MHGSNYSKAINPLCPIFFDPVAAARAWAEEFEQKNALTQQLAMASPKVDFADRISGTHKGMVLGQYAKSVGLGPRKIFLILRENQILIDQGGDHNLPFQAYIDRGYFSVKQGTYTAKDEERICNTALITGKGEVWLTKKLISLGVLKAVAA